MKLLSFWYVTVITQVGCHHDLASIEHDGFLPLHPGFMHGSVLRFESSAGIFRNTRKPLERPVAVSRGCVASKRSFNGTQYGAY